MLAKVVLLKNERGGHVSAKSVMDYLARESEELAPNQSIEGGTFNLERLQLDTPEDRILATQLIDHIAEAGHQKTHFKTNPLYHYALSWREGEHPTTAQCQQAAAHTLKTLGLEDNQAIWFVHRDTEKHHHLHVVVNRVHPESLTLTGPPRYDYFVLDKACRETELMQGWQHDNGPYAVIDGAVVKLSKKQRKELGLLAVDKPQHAPSPKDRIHELHTGVPAFAQWMREQVMSELSKTINEQATWQAVHDTLAKYGVQLVEHGGGLIFTTKIDDKENSTKASGIDYRFSAGRLTKALGEYRPSTSPSSAPITTYQNYVKNARSGIAANEHPGITGSNVDRTKKRVQRQQAREDLTQQFADEKRGHRSNAKSVKADLAQQHKQENKALLATFKASKSTRVSELTEQHGSNRLALGLYAAEKVIAVQNLRAQQKNEREALGNRLRMDWPDWLEEQARMGNETAKSALRGIRYREQRKFNKSRPGFEGEFLGDMSPYSQTETPAGTISGELFRLSGAGIQIDHQTQRIVYLDDAGNIRLTDSGPRIDVHKTSTDTIEQGLLLAAQKFGGSVYVTGDATFREQSARQATRMGIKIMDEDLHEVVQHERSQMQLEKTSQFSHTKNQEIER